MASFTGKITYQQIPLTSHWPYELSSANPSEGQKIPRVGLDCPSSAVEKAWGSHHKGQYAMKQAEMEDLAFLAEKTSQTTAKSQKIFSVIIRI